MTLVIPGSDGKILDDADINFEFKGNNIPVWDPCLITDILSSVAAMVQEDDLINSYGGFSRRSL